jgi:hypothetical protein
MIEANTIERSASPTLKTNSGRLPAAVFLSLVNR